MPALYLLGTRVEKSRGQVSKLFLFGLLRETIPLDHLAANVQREHDGGVPVTLARFIRIGGPGAFNLYRTWIWRGGDVDHLLSLAARPIAPDDTVRRQNGRLIAAVVLIGLAAFGLLFVYVWNMSPTRT